MRVLTVSDGRRRRRQRRAAVLCGRHDHEVTSRSRLVAFGRRPAVGGDHQNLKSPPQAGFYYVESRGKNHRYRNSDRRRRGCAAGRPGRKGLNPRATRGGPPKSRPWLLAPTRNPIQIASRLGAWGIAQAQEAGRACLGPRPRTRAGADQGRPGHCHLGAGICALIHSFAASRRHANWPGRLRKDFAVSLGFGGADGRRQTADGFRLCHFRAHFAL